MAKNIVVFSDGTGQDGSKGDNTNVYKLYNLILDRPGEQVRFYDKGIGTGWRKVTGNVAGRGFSKNIKQCYEFIFEQYESGDRIYLFGFSRGAATVRSLSGFIDLVGILPRSKRDQIEEAWKIYKITNHEKRKAAARAFLERHPTEKAQVEFLGVWDTVAALGVPNTRLDRFVNLLIPHGFHDFTISPSVNHACHALALDDVRRTFHPVLFEPGNIESSEDRERSLKQVWFMGMHTDVGGGYEKAALSDIPLEWMVQNAVLHGLRIHPNPDPERRVFCRPDPNGHMHDSRDSWWKRLAYPERTRGWNNEKFGRAVIHESVDLRTHDEQNRKGADYQPRWIMEHDPLVEPWTHPSDWNDDMRFVDAKPELDALAGWCVPVRPDRP